LKKLVLTFMILVAVLTACSKTKAAKPVTDNAAIKKVRETLAAGKYEEALKQAKEITAQVPAASGAEEALYLQGYILAYGKSDFQGPRTPLKQLLDIYPAGSFAPQAQKLLADCQYWQGNYDRALKEYKKLGSANPGGAFDSYIQMQEANCLLLNDKVADALTAYRELVEKYPTDPLADSAQMMIANTYLKLQNFAQAKKELQKLMSFSRNGDVQHAAQKALRQIEEEEPFQKKGVGVPD